MALTQEAELKAIALSEAIRIAEDDQHQKGSPYEKLDVHKIISDAEFLFDFLSHNLHV